MNTLNPYFVVTIAVFAVYLLLALLGSRERGAEASHRLRARAFKDARYLRKQSYSLGTSISGVSVRHRGARGSLPKMEHPWKS